MKSKISFIRFLSLCTRYFFMLDAENRVEFFFQIASALKQAHGNPNEISIKTADLSHEHLDIAMDIFKDLKIDAKPIRVDENGLHFSVTSN